MMGFKEHMGIESYKELPQEVFAAGKHLIKLRLFGLALVGLIGAVLLWFGVTGFAILSLTFNQFLIVLGGFAVTYGVCYVLDLRSRIITLEKELEASTEKAALLREKLRGLGQRLESLQKEADLTELEKSEG